MSTSPNTIGEKIGAQGAASAENRRTRRAETAKAPRRFPSFFPGKDEQEALAQARRGFDHAGLVKIAIGIRGGGVLAIAVTSGASWDRFRGS